MSLSIVHVIARLNVGGAALHVLQLAHEQSRRGHDVVVVAGTLAAGEESMEYVAEELGVEVLRLPVLQRELSVRADPAAILALRRIIRQRRPDVLHTHTAKAGATGRLAAMSHPGRARPRAIVHTYHGHVLSGYFSRRWEWVFRSIERALALMSGTLIAVSDEVRDDLVAFGVAPAQRFVVVPYGFDLPPWAEADEQARRTMRAEIGAGTRRSWSAGPGSLTAIKRPLDLIRTLRALVDDGVDALLVLVGDGEDRPDVEALAAELGGRRPLPLRRLPEEHPPLVRVVRRSAADVGERGHTGGRDRGARGGAAGRRDPGRRHRHRGQKRRERLPRGDRRHDRARRRGSRQLAARPRAARADGRARSRGRARAFRGRADGGRGRGDLPPAAAREGPPPPQADRRQRLGGAPARAAAGPARARRRRPLPRARRARTPMRGASTRRSTGSASPTAPSAAAPDVSPRMARDVVRAVRAEQPDLVHTHLVHADVYGGAAARLLGIPSISTRHNDDRYLLGPFRYVDRAFARPARRLIAISDAVRHFLERAGHDPAKLVTIRYGLDELPAAASEPTPAAAGIPVEAPLALAVGRLIEQKDHATLLRGFARVRVDCAGGTPRHPRQRPARGGDAAARRRARAGRRRDPARTAPTSATG